LAAGCAFVRLPGRAAQRAWLCAVRLMTRNFMLSAKYRF